MFCRIRTGRQDRIAFCLYRCRRSVSGGFVHPQQGVCHPCGIRRFCCFVPDQCPVQDPGRSAPQTEYPLQGLRRLFLLRKVRGKGHDGLYAACRQSQRRGSLPPRDQHSRPGHRDRFPSETRDGCSVCRDLFTGLYQKRRPGGCRPEGKHCPEAEGVCRAC